MVRLVTEHHAQGMRTHGQACSSNEVVRHIACNGGAVEALERARRISWGSLAAAVGVQIAVLELIGSICVHPPFGNVLCSVGFVDIIEISIFWNFQSQSRLQGHPQRLFH